MNILKSLDQKTKLFHENSLLKFAIVVVCFSGLVSNIYAYKTRKDVRTIVTPSHFNKPFEVSESWMDDNGIFQYTSDVMVLLLNYTPKTAIQNFSNFEKFLLPKDYSASHEKLQDELAQIDRLKIVSTFIPEKTTINRVEKSIHIRGLRRKDSHGRNIINGPEEWKIYYRISNANFYVAEFNKIER